MADLRSPELANLSALVDKIALESVFAEPGKDNGLLPINSLLADMEAVVGGGGVPAGIIEGVSVARGVVDAVFEVGTFQEGNLQILKQWSSWMGSALLAADAGEVLPPMPDCSVGGVGEGEGDVLGPIGKPELFIAAAYVDKVILEIGYLEPGKDGGLLPINSLLGDIEGALGGVELPEAFRGGFARLRTVVDGVFEVGTFSPVAIRNLQAWAEWVRPAMRAADSGGAIPELLEPGLEERVEIVAEEPSVGVEEAGLPPEEPLKLNLEGDAELLAEFVAESHEHLQNIELGVLTLEENPTDADTLNSIFRAFHTFKGGSGFLNLVPINKLAHELESLLDQARQHRLVIDAEVTNVILAGGDTLNQFVQRMEAQLGGGEAPGEIVIPTQALLVRVRGILSRGSGGAAAEERVSVVEAKVESASEPVVAALEGGPAVVEASAAPARVEGVVSPQADVEPVKVSANAESARKAVVTNTASVKVDTAKLDSLVDLVGEMVIAQSMVAQDPGLAINRSEQLTRNFAQLTRITRDLQRVSMSLRMVPIRGTFQKMNRVVRDLAMKAGKQVQLATEGEETELDRTIVEELNDPLVHMIRNSLDHGLEKAETRLAAGKSPYGTVTLRAYHQGGNIVIEVSDDGAGLNRERILKKAIERGLARPGDELTDKEVFGFIFGAGFSTAEKITDISGRGVGMDVVRRNIEKLRGKIEVESELGKGTRISIHLPLTLAIIDGLIVGVGAERYIVPTLSVRESFRPTKEMLSTVQQRGELVNVRGQLMPLLRLHDLFGCPGAVRDPKEAIVLVVESDTRTRCLMVDQLIGKQEVVIKSLGDTMKRNPGLAGAAILGDGRVGLILDVAGLMDLSVQAPARAA
ncbi:MAG: hypothetical protein RI897_1378 [Verrucomicrobiota bacterium]|jgi:two-component system chemotaxis sensor kinase CheA